MLEIRWRVPGPPSLSSDTNSYPGVPGALWGPSGCCGDVSFCVSAVLWRKSSPVLRDPWASGSGRRLCRIPQRCSYSIFPKEAPNHLPCCSLLSHSFAHLVLLTQIPSLLLASLPASSPPNSVQPLNHSSASLTSRPLCQCCFLLVLSALKFTSRLCAVIGERPGSLPFTSPTVFYASWVLVCTPCDESGRRD